MRVPPPHGGAEADLEDAVEVVQGAYSSCGSQREGIVRLCFKRPKPLLARAKSFLRPKCQHRC